MSQASVNTQIDTDITNKTAAESITAANVGNNMKAVNNRIEEAIGENIQNNLMPSATNAVTANAVLAGLDSVKPYKSYVALISQSGTGTPTVTVLENSIGGTVTSSRNANGRYDFTFTGTPLTDNKTVIFVTPDNSHINFLTANKTSTSVVRLISQDLGEGVPSYADGLTNVSLEIRVYN